VRFYTLEPRDLRHARVSLDFELSLPDSVRDFFIPVRAEPADIGGVVIDFEGHTDCAILLLQSTLSIRFLRVEW
jgi:hypothetical protein